MKDPRRHADVASGRPWTEKFTVRAYETDPQGRLCAPCLCQFLQEAAAGHAAALGLGLAVLNGQGLTWVLSRLRLTLHRLPAAAERIWIDTWPSGADRLFAFRDFAAADQSGSAAVTADSAWLVIDTEKRRPVRIGPFLDRLRIAEHPPVLKKPIPKLPPAGPSAPVRRFQVRYRDLDANRHVNNVSYVEWMLESLGSGFLQSASPAALQVDFIAEALADDAVVCTVSPAPGKTGEFVHGVFREADGRELARAKTVWKGSVQG